jgi:hypothetical protein
MAAINLLPQDLKPDESALKISSKLKKIATISAVVVLVVGGIAIGSYFILNQRINESIERQDDLEQVIDSLSETEQRLVLVQDRLALIDELLNNDSAKEEVEMLENMVNLQTDSIKLANGELNETEALFGFNVNSSSDITSLLAQVAANPDYSFVRLTSLSFTQEQRYSLDLQLLSN